jgi:Zn-dependent peptidase ImmA (M78 family)
MASKLRRGFKTWCENAAISYRRDLQLGRSSPLDPVLLAKHLRVVVWAPEEIPGINQDVLKHLTVTDPDSWDAVTIQSDGVTAIVLNSAPSIARRNNSLAHELSHIILEHDPAHIFYTPDGHLMMNEYNSVHEEEANCLAGTLLLPRDAIIQAIRDGMDDRDMADYFNVSPQLLRMRRSTTGVDRQLSYSRF